MDTSTILTFLAGIVTIIVNICIAIYNVGKNRKIYEIERRQKGKFCLAAWKFAFLLKETIPFQTR